MDNASKVDRLYIACRYDAPYTSTLLGQGLDIIPYHYHKSFDSCDYVMSAKRVEQRVICMLRHTRVGIAYLVLNKGERVPPAFPKEPTYSEVKCELYFT